MYIIAVFIDAKVRKINEIMKCIIIFISLVSTKNSK